ncbi:MAG TPA: hemerythrin domain-containing protein [Acidimicrobiales bacterium]|jgi:iron-sulfur cluster repair protein YtfE (RIC family)|nr:hemerythrin domain-containing protein [Acidimicrobiales bacterium]
MAKTKKSRRRVAWVIAPATVLAVATARRARRRRALAADESRPADVAFMRAMHAAFRRDLARLESVAPHVDRSGFMTPQVRTGWTAFRDWLRDHHAAEDDDLWPVLRARLVDASALREVDAMVAEHRSIPGALAAVDAALANGFGVRSAAADLAAMVHDHLDHEERSVFPLLEQHLSRQEWRRFLETERDRHSLRERPRWLAWVLDDASERDAAAVMAEMPRPAHVVYRWFLRPRYAAEHRWQTEATLARWRGRAA